MLPVCIMCSGIEKENRECLFLISGFLCMLVRECASCYIMCMCVLVLVCVLCLCLCLYECLSMCAVYVCMYVCMYVFVCE